MDCKVLQCSVNELACLPKELTNRVNKFLAKWDKDEYRTKVMRVKINDVLYESIGQKSYKVFIEIGCIDRFVIFTYETGLWGQITDLYENWISVDDINCILKASRHFK